MLRRLLNTWRPEVYQGSRNMKAHFEGWYYKLVDREENNIIAVIPGISFDRHGKAHCFIQVLDGKTSSSRYFRYDIEQFDYSRDRFEVWIGESFFSKKRVSINLKDGDISITGELSFSGLCPWPSRLFSPGAMGWYAFMPLMECYHGVISFDHEIEGGINLGGSYIDFSGGRGYIEKDWGKSFPRYYTWAQCNHFEQPGTSIMISIANIPWLGRSFDGFIAGLYHSDKLYPFSTYNGTRLEALEVKPRSLKASFTNKNYNLQVEADKAEEAQLAAPKQGGMEGRIAESMTSEIRFKLFTNGCGERRLILEGRGRNAAIEIAGAIEKFKQLSSTPGYIYNQTEFN